MEVDDPVAQEDLLRAIFQANVVPEAEKDAFERINPISLPLSRLRDCYVKRQSRWAIQYLDCRAKIKIDPEMRIEFDSDRVLWSTTECCGRTKITTWIPS
jgi:hypothetical protein